ncbi:MAG: hypothetical protein MUF71_13435 [Candidatus Kapabacteria bacterium]|nr:hypothetical protein [Candidatus Kapabacteria bacterium]
MKKYLLAMAIFVSFGSYSSAQILTLEGGGGFLPTNPTTSWGLTLQIPVYAGFGLYGSWTRLVADDPRRASSVEDVKRRYPILSSSDPNFVFPQTSTLGPFWGNQLLSAGITYTIPTDGNLAFDIGAGWCAIEGVTITPAIFVGNILRFPESPYAMQYQSFTAFGAVKYKLGSAFSVQGKISAFGLTHGLAMLGISWHPFNP